MSLKHGILGLLNYGSMSGYELNSVFKESLSFFWSAQTSQIYRELETMEKNGWVENELVIQEGRPNKKLYSLTDEGKTEYHNWLSNSESDIENSMKIRSAFLMRVFFAGELSDEDAIKLIEDYLKECLKTAERLTLVEGVIDGFSTLTQNADKRSKYWKLTALYGEAYYTAEITWAKKAIEILRGEKDEDVNN